jgi:hypothetical protein
MHGMHVPGQEQSVVAVEGEAGTVVEERVGCRMSLFGIQGIRDEVGLSGRDGGGARWGDAEFGGVASDGGEAEVAEHGVAIVGDQDGPEP